MIDVSIADGCATITAPDFSPLSTHDAAFARELAEAVIDLSDDDYVKVIVLRALGNDFAPGTPAATPHSLADTLTTWERDFSASNAIYQALCFSKKVTITEVAGSCAGAGSMLVLSTDLTVSSADAAYGSPFMAIPESNFVLAALTIRLNRAKAWMLRDTVIPAAHAHEIGLVNEVVARDELQATTQRLAESITRTPLDGIVMSKMLLQAVLDGHGVGREFDMADLYANALWNAGQVPS